VTGTSDRAQAIVSALQQRIEAVRQQAAKSYHAAPGLLSGVDGPPLCVRPLATEMVAIAGGIDGVGNDRTPSTQITWETVRDYQPEVVILMPCGADVPKTLSELDDVQALPGWADLPAVRNGRLYAVDAGAYFSRSGPRLVDGLELLAQIIQPELFPWNIPETIAMRVPGPKESQPVSA
jgi:iron complex transport system substrate-binding protein